MSEAWDPKAPCDLCSLPVGVKPFALVTPERTLAFCCEGCKGIYQMLHQINESSGPIGDNSPAPEGEAQAGKARPPKGNPSHAERLNAIRRRRK